MSIPSGCKVGFYWGKVRIPNSFEWMDIRSGTFTSRWDHWMALPSMIKEKKPHLAEGEEGATCLSWPWLGLKKIRKHFPKNSKPQAHNHSIWYSTFMLYGLPTKPKSNLSLNEPQMIGLPGIWQEQIQVLCGGTYFKPRPQRIPTAKFKTTWAQKQEHKN